MFIIVDGLARLLAPVLSVTMDELWRMLPGEREESVHMALFPRDLDHWKDAALLERWAALAAVRDQVNLQLEEKRKDKTIAAQSFGARGRSKPTARRRSCSSDYREFLPTLFGVSEVELKTPHDLQRPWRWRRRHSADRHQVRALLALRARGQRRARSHRASVRAASRRCRTGEPIGRCASRAELELDRRRHRGDPRSDHQGDGPPGAGAARKRRGDSRLSRFDARAQHRRGVRHVERGGLSVQDAWCCRWWRRSRSAASRGTLPRCR